MTADQQPAITFLITDCLEILYRRAGDGAKARPTVGELNRIIQNLEAAKAIVSR